MKQRLVKWLAAAVLAVGCTTLTAGAFTDTENHWAASAINKWSQEYGIIQGYDDGTFRPDNSITRGAFAGILDRFLHFQTTSGKYLFRHGGNLLGGRHPEAPCFRRLSGQSGQGAFFQHHYPPAGGGHDRQSL